MSYASTLQDRVPERVREQVRRISSYSHRHDDTIPGAQLTTGLAILALFLSSLAIIVFYSFLEQAPPQYGAQFTIQNYVEFLRNDFYRLVLWDSLVIAVESTVAALVVAYPVSYYLAFTESEHRNLMLLLVVLPFWINLVIRTYAWRLILGNQGVVNYLLVEVLAVSDQPRNLLFTQEAIVLGLLHIFLPYMVLPMYVSLDNVDRAHIEAAKNLGANDLQAFYEVTLPQSIPGAAAGIVLSFVLAFGAFVVPLLLGGTEHLMIANLIGQAFIEQFDWSLGSAMAICVTVFVLAFVYVFNSLVGLEELYGDGGDVE